MFTHCKFYTETDSHLKIFFYEGMKFILYFFSFGLVSHIFFYILHINIFCQKLQQRCVSLAGEPQLMITAGPGMMGPGYPNAGYANNINYGAGMPSYQGYSM